ncbi:unnamed protein product [Rotaria sordida]|uniref:PhoD-like phosphatase domain-containing protein n=1 Tax=Rotaria sordida TaxID=392033 RepID=A0A814S9U6_9BILA|nr:unnamed protein product [Rotaria sordida]CAF1448993.1 unnamed protein product [Rotaria sordida]
MSWNEKWTYDFDDESRKKAEHREYRPEMKRALGSTPKQVNSIFGLPGTYDDLLDEWTHVNHITERNDVLQCFQNFAEINKIQVTFFSSGVHCCGKEEDKDDEVCETVQGEVYHQNVEIDQEQQEANNLKVRFWLESVGKKTEVPKFSSYDLLIPNLK